MRAGEVASPPKHVDSLASGSPAPSTTAKGGGPLGAVERDDTQGDDDDVLSLHPNEMLQMILPTSQQLVDKKFRQYQTNIARRENIWHHLYLWILLHALMQLITHPFRSHRK